MEFLITQLFPTYAFLNRIEFSTVPFKIHPLEIKAVSHNSARIVLCRRKIVDLGINIRILLEEIISHFRLQEIHVGLIVGIHGMQYCSSSCLSCMHRSALSSYNAPEYHLPGHTCPLLHSAPTARSAVFCG